MIKNIISMLLISSISLFAGINSTYKESTKQNPLDKINNKELIEKLIIYEKTKLPIVVDSYTIIKNVERIDSNIIFYIEVSQEELEKVMGQAIDFNKSFTNNLAEITYKNIRTQICSSSSSKYVINRDIRYQYIYTYDTGVQVVDFTVGKEDCKEEDVNNEKEL